MYLEPLGEEEIGSIFRNWGLNSESYPGFSNLCGTVQGHALSARIAAASIVENKGKSISFPERISISDFSDEGDPNLANKAIRILDWYAKEIPDEEMECLTAFSAFKRNAEITMFLELLDTELFLKKEDVRKILWRLVEKRLLQVENGVYVTAHPLVREFFIKKSDKTILKEIYKKLVELVGKKQLCSNPNSLEEAIQLIDLCHYSGKAFLKDQYFQIFYTTLNRKHRNFLGNNIGAWDEFLELVDVGLEMPHNLLNSEELIYLHASRARARKHLGKCKSAKQSYLECLDLCIKDTSVHTARYSNNFLELLIVTGERDTAHLAMEINAASLKWIREDWYRAWQTEHAFYRFGQLAGMDGCLDASLELYEFADRAWKNEGIARQRMFDTGRINWSRILLAKGNDYIDKALEKAYENVIIAKENNWLESLARSLCQLSSVHRILGDNEKWNESISKSKVEAEKINLPVIWLEIQLEQCRKLLTDFNNFDVNEFEKLAINADSLCSWTGLKVYEAEMLAAYGILALSKNDFEKAEASLHKSIASLHSHTNMLQALIPGNLIQFLNDRLSNKFNLSIKRLKRDSFPSPEDLLSKSVNFSNIFSQFDNC